jgi:protein-S-isoprenylcysteine O-methyltransferase Ste14
MPVYDAAASSSSRAGGPYYLDASDFEFRYRFWIFGALFCLAFAAYNIDHHNTGAALTESIARLRGTTATAMDYRVTFTFAALFCVAAALIRTWATAYLKPEVMVDKQIHTTRLVADGPYRSVRNPLYFGNILLAVGVGIMASRAGFAILLLGMIWFDYRLILREESELVVSQGERFQAYCAAVPRLLPALRPKLPRGEDVPNWKEGMLGEAFMWVIAASVVTFALSLNLKAYFIVMAASFVVYPLCLAVIKHRQKQKLEGLHGQP